MSEAALAPLAIVPVVEPMIVVVWAAVLLVPAVRLVRRSLLSGVLRGLSAALGIFGLAVAVEIASAVTDKEQDSSDTTYVILSFVCALPALLLLVAALKGPTAPEHIEVE